MAFLVGQVAMGDNFWDREFELKDIWDAIQGGGNVLLSAPRRVGKTSIMRKIEDEPKEGYVAIYINTESADSENEFWAKLYHAIIREEFVNKLQVKRQYVWEKVKKIKIKKITAIGVELEDGRVTSFKELFKKIIEDIGGDMKLIIMIDEFAQTVENIIKYEDEKNALSLLKTHHTLRQDRELSDKITFVYAGSIGLESVVYKINATKYISDLTSVKILPLEFEDAKKFIAKLLSTNKFKMENTQVEYLLEKIEWLIPFYIQLILDEIKKLYRRDPNITNETIDQAVENAIGHRNYFDHWQTKLKEAFTNKSYLFAKEILNTICEKMTIAPNEILNIAIKHSLDEDNAKEIVRSLVYDGYINNNDDAKEYRFNSTILRMWWYKNVTS